MASQKGFVWRGAAEKVGRSERRREKGGADVSLASCAGLRDTRHTIETIEGRAGDVDEEEESGELEPLHSQLHRSYQATWEIALTPKNLRGTFCQP